MCTVAGVLSRDAEAVTDWLERYFDQIGYRSGSLHPSHLQTAMRYSSVNGGKRMRASLVLAGWRLARGGDELWDDTALAVAGAVEMLHAYSLVHDDLPAMDDANIRRGQPACHKKFDEATAILAGDALQTEAFAILSRDGLCGDPARQLELVQLLAMASGEAGMAGGQMLDLMAETKIFDLPQIRYMQELKTGALIRAAALMGVVAGNGDTAMQKAVSAYAQNLGLAFQIADDILDYEGDAGQLGKPAGRDAEQGKASFVDLLGLQDARRTAAELVSQATEMLDIYGSAAAELQALAHFTVDRKS